MGTGNAGKNKGFTLVEILLAFLILMIGVLGVMSLFPVGVQSSKAMMDQSTAALVARNVRGSIEATNLADAVFNAYGMDRGQFPKYFPQDMPPLVQNYLASVTNNVVNPPIVGKLTKDGKGVIDTGNSQYSWEARFDVGRGNSNVPWGWTDADVLEWQKKYFRTYAVQISVYRNYREVTVPNGTISVDVETGYDSGDPNSPLVCTLTLSQDAPVDLQVGWYIRVPAERSDWYMVEKIDGRVLTLDRVYVYRGQFGTGAKSGIIGTDRLQGHFTTMVAAFND